MRKWEKYRERKKGKYEFDSQGRTECCFHLVYVSPDNHMLITFLEQSQHPINRIPTKQDHLTDECLKGIWANGPHAEPTNNFQRKLRSQESRKFFTYHDHTYHVDTLGQDKTAAKILHGLPVRDANLGFHVFCALNKDDHACFKLDN